MKRTKIALYIALGATALTFLGIILLSNNLEFGLVPFVAGLIGAIVSYFFGGFLTALRISWKIATIGWFITPFPIDIFTFIATFIFGIYMFLFLPIIPVGKAYWDSRHGY